jgi:hypothetical protein
MNWETVGVVVLVILLISLIYARQRVNIKVEPFASGETPKDVAANIQSAASALRDELNIGTYRESYEDMVTALEEWSDNMMLTILNGFNEDRTKMMPSVNDFNAIYQFKQNLGNLMAFVDKS